MRKFFQRLGWARANIFDNEIYDCHSKHALHRNLYLHPQNMSKFENIFEIISSIDPSISMAPRQQTIIQTQNLDRMRLCFRINVRFSDALLVFNKLIQRMQDTLTYNEYIPCCCSSWHAVMSRSSSQASFRLSRTASLDVRNTDPNSDSLWLRLFRACTRFLQFSSVQFIFYTVHITWL